MWTDFRFNQCVLEGGNVGEEQREEQLIRHQPWVIEYFPDFLRSKPFYIVTGVCQKLLLVGGTVYNWVTPPPVTYFCGPDAATRLSPFLLANLFFLQYYLCKLITTTVFLWSYTILRRKNYTYPSCPHLWQNNEILYLINLGMSQEHSSIRALYLSLNILEKYEYPELPGIGPGMFKSLTASCSKLRASCHWINYSSLCFLASAIAATTSVQRGWKWGGRRKHQMGQWKTTTSLAIDQLISNIYDFKHIYMYIYMYIIIYI